MVENQNNITDVKLMWIGHAGFKMVFKCDNTERVIYFDPWIGNPKYPASLRDEAGEAPMPTDADLILITHGHWDHSQHASDIQKASTKEGCQIACGYELGQHYKVAKGVPEAGVLGCGKGGTIDLGFCRISQVSADHSSSCGFSEDGIAHYAGAAAGWVVRLANGVSVYHAGDTNVFGDMQIINDMYKPTHMCLPIGGHFTMGPEECAFALQRFLTHAHTVIPMHFLTFPLLKGDVPALTSEMKRLRVDNRRVVNSYEEALGQWLDLSATAQ